MYYVRKHYPIITALIGALLGYFFLHPFVMISNEIFHISSLENHEMVDNTLNYSQETQRSEFLRIIKDCFTIKHLPHSFSFVFLSGILGYVYGFRIKTLNLVNEQLQRFSSIGRNTSSIIHDLNNPLTGIKGYVELLETSCKEPKHIHYCENIELCINNIMHMILEIKLTAQGTNEIILEKVPVNIETIIAEVKQQIKANYPIIVEAKYSGDVMLDRHYFERVVWNLLKNSLEALEASINGKIEISVAQLKNFVLITFKDNGPGLPQEIKNNLFKFGQTKKKKYGCGIGLYNCRKIVEAHNGTIWFDSKNNIGTVCYVKLPL